MKVTVFGIGYVGLVQAAVLAEVGHNVVCVDIDAKKIEGLKAGNIPIFEPDLDVLVERNVKEGRLHFTTDAKAGVEHAGIQFIAVGTPPDEDGSADLKYVTAVAKTIAQHMLVPQIIVNKSTVPVGTGDMVREVVGKALADAGKAISFDVVSNPEFLKEGSAVADCMKPDRIIVGTSSKDTEMVLRQLYAPFNRNHEKMIVMDTRSAELTKYAANCMLATKISFMNEMANIAESLGADIEWVRKGIGSDPRIGYSFIYPGIGYGGSCFPKDVQALIRTAEKAGVTPTVLTAVEARNNAQKQVLFDKIERYFGGDLEGKTFALWGLAFKPNTDDMREAPARVLMEALWEAGAKVRAYDPEAMEETARIYGPRNDLTLVDTREQALEGADALVIATEWKVFQSADFDAIKSELKSPAIFDGRNIYDPSFMKQQGFDYFAIGRGEQRRSA
jgi:UDPglucose 6-dehydrogenase